MFSIDRVLPARVERGRPVDHPPDVGLPVAALCREDLRRPPAGLLERREIDALEFGDQRAVRRPAQLGDRPLVDARVDVDEERAVFREAGRVVGFRVGQTGEARPVEVDAVVVDEVRVLAGVHPAPAEPDLPLLIVDARDAADHPLTPGDLVLHRARHAVEEIEVVPAVPLRHPDDLAAVSRVVPELLARIGEEGLRLFRDDGPRGAGGGIRLDDPEHLVAALVVFEGERGTVLAPLEPREIEGIGEERVVDGQRLLALDGEDDRLLEVEDVARLGVEARRVLRLQLVLGRGLDVMHEAAVSRLHAIRRELLRVGRPRHRVEFVAVGLRPVGAEHRERLGARLADGDVEVGDHRFPLAVRRHAGLRVRGGRRAGRGRLPLLERADGRRLRARVVRQRARPRRTVEARFDRALVVFEGEGVERKRDRRDLPARHLRKRGGELLVVERRALLAGVGIDQHEFVPALHRPPVPEAMGLLDPGGRPGHVERERFVLLAQAGGPLVVGGRDLGATRAPRRGARTRTGATWGSKGAERSGHARILTDPRGRWGSRLAGLTSTLKGRACPSRRSESV